METIRSEILEGSSDHTGPEYFYDSMSDVHTFHPVRDGVVGVGDESIRSTLVVKIVDSIVSILINVPLEESEKFFEVHNKGTQT